MHTPYTPFFTDAFIAAHSAIGLMLIAFLWWLMPRMTVVRTILLAAIAFVVVAPLLGTFLQSFGAKTPPMRVEEIALLASTCLVVVAALLEKRFVFAVGAVGMAYALQKLGHYVEESTLDVCALHLAWLGVSLGILRRQSSMDAPSLYPTSLRYPSQDWIIFAIATLTAVFVSIFVLERADSSADEWAYTWMASVFARGHLYGAVPPCERAFQSFYVFDAMGRMFSQYTPGWPLFMTPFALFRVPWLAGPVAYGVMAVGIARATRSIVQLDGHATQARIRAAGFIAAMIATFGTTIVLNGAGRYSHVFVAGLFAWSIETLLVLRSAETPQRQIRSGALLGFLIAMMGATRPADGAMLAFGLAVYFVVQLAQRRIKLRGLLATLATFTLTAGVVLVILRVQVGSWFTTGYSVGATTHPWAVATFGWPKKNEWRVALPLATGTYCWYPASFALGLAGIASLRQKARWVLAVFVLSSVPFNAYYQSMNLGRGYDWGFGPRYELPFVVLMAVGTGIAIAPLAEAARRTIDQRGALWAGGPFAIFVGAVVVTLVRLWPLLYPGIYVHMHQHDSLNAAIRTQEIHNAVVVAQMGTTGFDSRDLTENLPIDLYPNQDVLIAVDHGGDDTRCLRMSFPDRTFYRAHGTPPVIYPF